MRFFIMATVLALTLAITGCWTSITTSLLTPQVYPKVKQLEHSRVIDAPQFLEAMRKMGATTLREFRIRPGTTLRIRVGNEDIGGDFMVDPSGSIDFPYVGLITVADKTIIEMRDELSSRLEKYYKDPNISVNLARATDDVAYSGLKAYVLSEGSSRVFPLSGAENLIDLIAAEGTFGERLAIDLIAVYKPPKEDDTEGKGTVVICNLMKLLKEGDHRQNIPIEHQDIVFVPTRENTLLEEFVASMSAISSILSAPIQIESGIRYWLRNPRTRVYGRSRMEGELYSNPSGSSG